MDPKRCPERSSLADCTITPPRSRDGPNDFRDGSCPGGALAGLRRPSGVLLAVAHGQAGANGVSTTYGQRHGIGGVEWSMKLSTCATRCVAALGSTWPNLQTTIASRAMDGFAVSVPPAILRTPSMRS